MIHGGGEYGEAWHQAVRLATKTVSSDDVAVCATWLGQNGYGNAHHLGIRGGSAGGFLMGLALTRNPQLYRAVVSEVGIYDLLRVELTPNGAYNTPEFGTVKDPAQFASMLTQSPYHGANRDVSDAAAERRRSFGARLVPCEAERRSDQHERRPDCCWVCQASVTRP